VRKEAHPITDSRRHRPDTKVAPSYCDPDMIDRGDLADRKKWIHDAAMSQSTIAVGTEDEILDGFHYCRSYRTEHFSRQRSKHGSAEIMVSMVGITVFVPISPLRFFLQCTNRSLKK